MNGDELRGQFEARTQPAAVTPKSLAADFDEIARWMATRPNGITWTGDGLDGTVAGLRDAAKSIRENLEPTWDGITAERDRYRHALKRIAAGIGGAGAERIAREALGMKP